MTDPRPSLFHSRALPLIAGLALFAATTPASAQTVIRITTAGGASCVATTDPRGLTLVQGSTDLQATGVTFVPAGCGAVTLPPAPTSTNNLVLGATATSVTAPYTYTISWNVSNATTCVGAVTSGTAANVTGWGTFNGPFNGATSAPISITTSGTYGLTLTCSNAGNPTPLVSPMLTLSPQGGAGSCAGPAGLSRIVTSDVYYGALTSNIRNSVDLQEWGHIWGHFNPTDSEALWPGASGSQPTLINFQPTSYLAAHFRTGSPTGPNGPHSGFFLFPFLSAPSMDMTISTACGDFTGPPAGCKATAGSPGGNFVSWTFATNNQTKCILQPNADYWVNMKFTNPSTCPVGAQYCQLPTALQSQ